MSWLSRLLGIKPDDWLPIWYDYAKWEVTVVSDYLDDYIEYRSSDYFIDYSQCRNEYRLRSEGYRPYNNEMYNKALQTLALYNATKIKK